MPKIPHYQGTPRVDGQHPDVWSGSPSALIAVFVESLRARFRDDNRAGLPYYWDDDPTPAPDEENTEDKPRKLYIESQYLADPDARDLRPALLVERGALQYTQIAIGNRGAYDVPTSANLYVAHGVTPLSVMCVSKERGESASLGDLVAFFLLATKNEFREVFGFHDISMPALEPTQVYRRSANSIEEWVTPVTLQVTCKYLWREVPIAPRLHEIRLRLGVGPTSDGPTQEFVKYETDKRRA